MTLLRRRTLTIGMAGALAAPNLATPALAQTARPTTIVVGFPRGGEADVLARL